MTCSDLGSPLFVHAGEPDWTRVYPWAENRRIGEQDLQDFIADTCYRADLTEAQLDEAFDAWWDWMYSDPAWDDPDPTGCRWLRTW